MYTQAQEHYAAILQQIRDAGLYKHERVIDSPQARRHRGRRASTSSTSAPTTTSACRRTRP